MRGRRLWFFALGIAAYAACADPPPPTIYFEDFETLCDGTPCGWGRTSGDETQATWVETIHEGDHGLRLSGEVMVQSEEVAVDDGGFVSNVMLHAPARCDAGSSVRVDIVVSDSFGARYTGRVQLAAFPNWGEAPPDQQVGWVDAVPGNIASVVAIAITKEGLGACEISSIMLTDGGVQPGC